MFPSHKLLRGRFISFLHRLVEGLGPGILPYLHPALNVLLHTQVGWCILITICVITYCCAINELAHIIALKQYA